MSCSWTQAIVCWIFYIHLLRQATTCSYTKQKAKHGESGHSHHVASICNHQMCDDLCSFGIAASKLWNIARWTYDCLWVATGTLPAQAMFKVYIKNHKRYADLNANPVRWFSKNGVRRTTHVTDMMKMAMGRRIPQTTANMATNTQLESEKLSTE